MNYVVSGKEMMKIDSYTVEKIGVPQMVLMERAALSIYESICSRFNNKSRVLVVVEGGNNGGDGVAVARMLKLAGFDTEVYWINGLTKQTDAFMQQLNIAKNVGVTFIDELVGDGYDVVVDAIFGVGLDRAVIGRQAEAISVINSMDAYKISIDIPSGIDSYTGFVHGTAVKANETYTFGLMKLGLLLGQGQEYAGRVSVVDIGFPQSAIDFTKPSLYAYDEKDIERLLPVRKADTHKGTYGKIAIVGGKKNMAGAVLFAGEAAYRTGCGMVKICTVEDNRQIVQTSLPEALLTTFNPEDKSTVREAIKDVLAWADVIAVGPGLGTDEYAEYIVEKILRDSEKPVIVDADAINIIAKDVSILERSTAELVITPHLMEMSRLTGIKTADIKENKFKTARDFAEKYKVIVALKDSRTIVSDGSEQAYINLTGNNGMAVGGSGDALTGIIAGLCGQDMDTFSAARLGVCLHGLAGQEAAIYKGRYSMVTRDIVKCITKVIETEK